MVVMPSHDPITALPEVVVLLATYNGIRWLPEQLDSILSQEGVRVRVVALDDESVDGTRDWLVERAVHEPRLTVLPSMGPSGRSAANFYRLIALVEPPADGYLAFSDQDDIWLPGKLARHVELLRSGGHDGIAPFSAAAAGPQLEIALAHRTAFVANALGPPPQFLIDRVKEEGRLIGALAGRPVHAERHQAAGVDIIIAQGSEAGGHTGEIGSMVLIPEIVDAVDIPVLGAGGIGRGRQMAAAMALGAQGVWCGSVWLTTDEAETHPVVKQKFLAATSADTIRSRSMTGKPARMLKTAWTEEWDRADTPDPLGMPLQPILTNEAQARINRAAHTHGSGAEKLAGYFVGQIVGTMNQPKSAGQVVMDMVTEFIDAVESLAGQLEY